MQKACAKSMCKKHIHTNEKRALHDRIFMPTSWRSKHPDDEKCIGCLVLGELKEFTLLVYGRSPLLLVDGDSSNRKLLLPCMILPAQHPAYLFLHRNSHLLLNLSQVSCSPHLSLRMSMVHLHLHCRKSPR